MESCQTQRDAKNVFMVSDESSVMQNSTLHIRNTVMHRKVDSSSRHRPLKKLWDALFKENQWNPLQRIAQCTSVSSIRHQPLKRVRVAPTTLPAPIWDNMGQLCQYRTWGSRVKPTPTQQHQ